MTPQVHWVFLESCFMGKENLPLWDQIQCWCWKTQFKHNVLRYVIALSPPRDVSLFICHIIYVFLATYTCFVDSRCFLTTIYIWSNKLSANFNIESASIKLSKTWPNLETFSVSYIRTCLWRSNLQTVVNLCQATSSLGATYHIVSDPTLESLSNIWIRIIAGYI